MRAVRDPDDAAFDLSRIDRLSVLEGRRLNDGVVKILSFVAGDNRPLEPPEARVVSPALDVAWRRQRLTEQNERRNSACNPKHSFLPASTREAYSESSQQVMRAREGLHARLGLY